MAVSPSFLLFHPAFSYLAIMELGGKGKGGKKKRRMTTVTHFVFLFTSRQNENRTFIAVLKKSIGGK